MVSENGMIMMSEQEYKELKYIQHLLIDVLRKLPKAEHKEIKVSCTEFVNIYNVAINDMFEHNDNGEDDYKSIVYGSDVTVHWNGLYCNCYDGATVANNLLPALEDIANEIEVD